MRKVFRLQNLECANCAAKMERGISKLKGVNNVRVNFMTQKMTLEAEDDLFEQVMKEAAEVIRTFEPDCSIVR